MLDLDDIPRCLGYLLFVGFWFKKPRMTMNNGLVRITNDKEALEMAEMVKLGKRRLKFIFSYRCQPIT